MLTQKYDVFKSDWTDITISTYDRGDATPHQRLMVKIQGTTRSSKVRVLGSHLDSVTGRTTRARVRRAPTRAPPTWLEIHAYVAEEIGLVGSQNIAKDY